MVEDYKDLGVMNGWRTEPPEYTRCQRELKHRAIETQGPWTCYSYVRCDVCQIKWEVDSSD